MRWHGFHHVQLAMPAGHEDRARSFYHGVLGLREVEKPVALRDRGGAWFEGAGGLRVHLGVEVDFKPAAKAHPAFETDDLKGLRRLFLAAGVEIREASPIPGIDRCYVHDPFGNRLEMLELRRPRTTAT